MNIFVALSGGVDSSVSLALLKNQGHQVTGIFMKNWSGDEAGIQKDCPWEEDQSVAHEVCKFLNVPFRSFNFEKEYKEKVVEYFFSEYAKGRTPNPDVMCNKEIKFKLFYERAVENGAEAIATGHYARVIKKNNENQLYKGIDSNKDQSYFLHRVRGEVLGRTFFPIGHLIKAEVRSIAKELNLPNAKRPDSQGICFIGEINVMEYLMSRIGEKPGDIVDMETNKKVGVHKGVFFYTIGQRDKLGIGGSELPYYVSKKDIDRNIVYVVKGGENEYLFSSKVEIADLFSINESIEIKNTKNLSASIRYRQTPVKCEVEESTNRLFVNFTEKVKAPSSGQSVVFYEEDRCLGGAVII